ncbi:MAG: hypothetical protein K2W33_19705 [Burkholderiales bacterium]|nr:hypothetical protein [Burkholderiales bacterium]
MNIVCVGGGPARLCFAAERGQVITAFVMPPTGVAANEALVKTLQGVVKQATAPYKYPGVIRFADTLPARRPVSYSASGCMT